MDTKVCFKCHEEKPLSEFYGHPNMSKRCLNKCKTCTKRDAKIHRMKNPEKVRANDRAKYQKNRDKYLALQKAYNSRQNPIKKKASTAVGNAVRDGRLLKPDTCDHCGGVFPSRYIQGHHEDYSKPLDVIWLCDPCHKAVHHPVLLDLR